MADDIEMEADLILDPTLQADGAEGQIDLEEENGEFEFEVFLKGFKPGASYRMTSIVCWFSKLVTVVG